MTPENELVIAEFRAAIDRLRQRSLQSPWRHPGNVAIGEAIELLAHMINAMHAVCSEEEESEQG